MLLLLLCLSVVILGYNYVTDSNRVRSMAEVYLSRLMGGKVVVGSATLSIFEGLRLDDVKVYVDDGRQPDSLLFSAQSFALKYDPAKIIQGQLEAARIIAQKPHVHLVQNILTHTWNFQRLAVLKHQRPKAAPQPGKPPPLPEVLLRNARVDISELRKGAMKLVGFEALDGQLTPLAAQGAFSFDVQTRGAAGVGPWAHGTASIGGGPVDAELHDFNFGRDVRTMLWADLLAFWERHNLQGRIDTLRVHYQPPIGARKASFNIETLLNGVNLSVPPEDWLSAEDINRRARIRETATLMGQLYEMAGNVPPSRRPDVASSRPRIFFASPAAALLAVIESAPIQLREGSGALVFTQDGVEVKDVAGRIEGNAFIINGHLTGYKPDAPFSVRIRSLDNETLTIPASPPYLNAMPGIIHDIYSMIHPDGQCRLEVRVDRTSPGGRPLIRGQVDVVDGTFSSIFFPYTLRKMHGQIQFGYDDRANADFVHVIGMRGQGLAGGPNQDHWIQVDGDVGPLGPEYPDPQIVLHVKGPAISSEPALLAAFPPEVRKPLAIFDAEHTGKFPTFRGGFTATVLHRAGWAWRWTFDTDVEIQDASGKLQGFPYPLDHVAATLQVRDGYLDIINARMNRQGATMRVDGRVTWDEQPSTHHSHPDGVKTDIKLSLRDVPVDKQLMAAMPKDQSAWIERLGLSGKIDVDGRVFQGFIPLVDGEPIQHPAPSTQPSTPDDVRFDLNIAMHDGTLWPAAGTFNVSGVSGRLHLTPDAMQILELKGTRGTGSLSAAGGIDWSDGPPELALRVNAKSLSLDAPLYSLLPPDARQAWDQVQPHGTMDAEMTYRGPVGVSATPAAKEGPTTGPWANPVEPRQYQKAPPVASLPSGFHAVLKPLGMSCTIKSLPYELSRLTGIITIAPEKITLHDVLAHHGQGSVAVSGTGTTGDQPVWNLKLSGKNVAIDDALRKALPAALLTVVDAVKLHGSVDFDFPRFVYRGQGFLGGTDAPPAPAPPQGASPARTQPGSPATQPGAMDIDLASTIDLHKCTLDLGVPLEQVTGQLRMAAIVRNASLWALRGDLDLSNVTMGGRHLTDFHAHLDRPAGKTDLNLDKMQARLAGGNVAGQVHMSFPDSGPSKYVGSFIVRNADLQTLVGDAEKDIKGELTANMSLEGAWGDSAARRGRGEVVVTGRELYHIPLMMGLFQLTNLTLPIAAPFKSGDARYSIEGQRINFEQVDLKSDNMMMSGAGYMDFKSKQVRMTFTTDNPGGFKIPFLNDLWQGARGELLKIKIQGTVQAPKVHANPFGTFTTTIDQVLKEDAKKK